MLKVEGLNIGFSSGNEDGRVVKNVTFSLQKQEVVGIVGESGSGKSLTAMAIAGLLPPDVLAGGEIFFGRRRLRPGREEDWQNVRGREMGIVFQDPASSLNPLLPVGSQVGEVLRIHKGLTEREAEAEVIEVFKSLGIGPAKLRVRQYPHQLSGGMKQRVMLAAAICCNPSLLIADEPTTALDVTVQAQILGLLRRIVNQQQASLLIISHDLGVIAQLADRVLVMCAGEIVEEAAVGELFDNPLHPYTQTLLASVPRLDRPLYTQRKPVKEGLWVQGCSYASRCGRRQHKCLQEWPGRKKISPTRAVCCHFAAEGDANE
ncbi:ABC transporter ATP-binding protein [Dethiobacter alkaliphilus]|uniref:ABC transporter ATP-binding protein n=1 Tax=Dethiobacter alkaliphilus TaxID=427926 RepID=UPI0022280034|nr:ABC transporter ATP-binding protein [Dethiobacter alkaliphilus]MCW3490874.1 ABC transporter ATP-binding protein [Dethiobacter alkaliphilus]